jgi:hypothetical protein
MMRSRGLVLPALGLLLAGCSQPAESTGASSRPPNVNQQLENVGVSPTGPINAGTRPTAPGVPTAPGAPTAGAMPAGPTSGSVPMGPR